MNVRSRVVAPLSVFMALAGGAPGRAALLQAEDDPVDPVENSLVYHAAQRKAGVPAEMHLYVKGGHTFGLRRTSFPITAWTQLVESWLGTIGMISK